MQWLWVRIPFSLLTKEIAQGLEHLFKYHLNETAFIIIDIMSLTISIFLAHLVERKTANFDVVGSIPTEFN